MTTDQGQIASRGGSKGDSKYHRTHRAEDQLFVNFRVISDVLVSFNVLAFVLFPHMCNLARMCRNEAPAVVGLIIVLALLPRLPRMLSGVRSWRLSYVPETDSVIVTKSKLPRCSHTLKVRG
jgi:hypothetical protein